MENFKLFRYAARGYEIEVLGRLSMFVNYERNV